MPFPRTGSAGRARLRARRVLILLSFALPCGAQGQGQPPEALTLRSVYEAVDRANPRGRAAEQLARAADARVSGATRWPDPELQLGLMNFTVPRIAPDPALGMRQVQLMQMVPLPGKLAAATEGARARVLALSRRADDVRWEARSEAAMAFHEGWLAEQRSALARETRALLDQAATLASARYRAGEGKQGDVLRARVAVAEMEDEALRMDAMAQAQRGQLAAIAGLDAVAAAARLEPPSLPDSFPPLAQLQRVAMDGRPMHLAGAADVRAAEADERLARRERWPDVRLGVVYGERPMGNAVDRMASVMIGASLPVYARDRQLRMRDEAAAMRAMADAELASARVETQGRLAERHAEVASARRLAALYRDDILPQAEAAVESALSSYRSGTGDFTAVLEGRMAVNRARTQLLTLRANEARAWAEIERLTGLPFTDIPPLSPSDRGFRP